jgi:hypothetical protein
MLYLVFLGLSLATPSAFALDTAPAKALDSQAPPAAQAQAQARSAEDEFIDSDQDLSEESRKELRQLIEDARPELAQRSPAVLGPATDQPVDYR